MENRQPPYSPEAERAVLCSIIIDPVSVHRVATTLSAQDFYDAKNATIYAAMLAMINTGAPLDLITLVQFIDDMGQLHNIGGRSYLAEIMGEVATSTSITYHAQTVRDKSMRRQLLAACQTSQELIYNTETDIDSVIATVQNSVYTVNPFKNVNDDAATIISEIDEVQKLYAEKRENGQKYLGFSCGIEGIDRNIDGMRPGHVWVVGAWTSTGKTQFALNIVHSVLVQDIPVSIISLEMSRTDTIARLMGIRNNISSISVIKGVNDGETQSKIEEAKAFMRQAPLEVHTTYFELEKIIALIRRDVFLKKVKLVVVDYVQNIISEKALREYEIMTRAATSLQSLARELGITIYIVSQVSNDAEKGNAAGAGFKGSGALEAVADLAIRLKRNKLEEKETDEYVPVDINVTKNRHGFSGTIAKHYMWLRSGRFEYMPNHLHIPRTTVDNLKPKSFYAHPKT